MTKMSMIVLLCFLSVNSLCAAAEVKLVYLEPKNPTEVELRRELDSSGAIESVVKFLNDTFRIEQSLTYVFGSEDGPYFDPSINEIATPYFFVAEVRMRFINADYALSGVSVEEATEDALMHTMFHEFAHAMIAMYELPVLGREEDAADGLATVLLTEYFEDGQEIAISAADLFDLESNDRNVLEDEDFWDEHSLDEQRYFSTLCHVYGSSPEKYASIPEDEEFSEARAALCIEEYENLSRSWLNILKPYLH